MSRAAAGHAVTRAGLGSLALMLALACSDSHRPQLNASERDASTGAAAGDAGAGGRGGDAPNPVEVEVDADGHGEPDPAATGGAGAGDRVFVAAADFLNVMMVGGHWWSAVGTERCPGLRVWYSFENGRLTHRVIDHAGGCRDAELEQKGTYSLSDGELTMSLGGLDVLTASDALPVSQRGGLLSESRTIAIVRGALGLGPATHIDRGALIGRDAKHFSGRDRVTFHDEFAEDLHDQRIELGLRLSRSLRAVGAGDELQVHVLARVIEVTSGVPEATHEIELDYPAVVEPDRAWLQLVAAPLAGLDAVAALAAWRDMLRAAGAERQPETVQRLYADRLYPAQRFAPETPTVLISAQLMRTGLTRAARLPERAPLDLH